MEKSAIKLTKKELEFVNTRKGLEYLLRSEELDFKNVARQLEYEDKLAEIQIKMIKMQNRVVEKGERVLILFEGREFAGKGGAIHAITEHLNPRDIRTVALDKPTPKQSAQWYFKRYIDHLPEQGEIVFFDRSWYNRALVEPVNNYCSQKEYAKFMKEVNHFERMLSEDGIKLIKIYFAINKKEQEKRIEKIRKNPLRRWELSPTDLNAVRLWNKYTKYEKAMLTKTNVPENPWQVIQSDDNRDARLEASKKILQILR